MSKNDNKELFFIAIIPDEQTSHDIMQFKEQVASEFNSVGALRSPPHITLHMPFKWRKDRIEDLIRRLSDFSFDQYPFDITLRGFDAFEPRVVFVNVEESDVLRLYYTELSSYLRKELKVLNADYKGRGFHPHVTIAFRDLKKATFYEVKGHFEKLDYEASFKVNGFWLLKHDGAKWHPFKYFGLDQISES